MEKYIARCHRRLKKWGAPLENWNCSRVVDNEDTTTCELCNCEKVRFIHVMEHDMYFEEVNVGCICAGIMEGDILAAKERDRLMKNRAKRKLNFPKRKWKVSRNGSHYIDYKDKRVFINLNNGKYNCNCEGNRVWSYKGKTIENFISACYAAFDLIDPIDEVM